MSAVDDKAILDWCFVIGSLNLGVVGFLYSTYATARFSDAHAPPIAKTLRQLVRVIVAALVALALLATVTAWRAGASISVWVIVCCLAVTTACAVSLALRMD
jgi:Na+/H+-dicarboxylate symporter